MQHRTLGSREACLDQLRHWVATCCRSVIARREQRHGVPAAMLDLVAIPAPRRAHTEANAWGSYQVLGLELGIPPLALAVLVLAAAPRLWGMLAFVYDGLGAKHQAVDASLLAALLGGAPQMREAVARELRPDSPLVRAGLVTVCGTAVVATRRAVQLIAA
jgi:hypothetical protein